MPLALESLLFERYRIKKILGHGGMGSVYLAIDENITIPVAIKENLILTENYSSQFKKEATILAGLRHPNLPRVSDYFFIPGQGQYIVMDYIEGEDLRERIEREKKLSIKDVIHIGLKICDALLYLHNLFPKVIHRDIKPGNIRITFEGNVVLVDFGLAKFYEENQQTATGARAMTPGYSPPEQYGRGTTDERSDIYSLAATMYAALTGFIPEDSLERLSGKEKLTPLKTLLPYITDSFEKIIHKALELDPDKRYQKIEDFYSALLSEGDYLVSSNSLGMLSPPPIEHNFQQIRTGITQSLIKVSDANANNQSNKIYQKNWIFTLMGIALVLGILLIIKLNFQSKIFPSIPGQFNQDYLMQSTLSSRDISPTQTISSQNVVTPNEKNIKESEFMVLQPTPVGGGSGLIAYASNEKDNVMQIWTITVDGKTKNKLTDLADGACQPDWSPDGKKIVFISPCTSKKEIYEGARLFILDTENNNSISPLPLPLDPSGDFDPAWSPDGESIAFSSFRSGFDPVSKERILHLFLFNLEDSKLIEITDTRWKDRDPAWSKDSKKLAFVRKIAENEIWIFDLATSKSFVFSAKGGVNYLYPNWSLDNQMMFYTVQKNSTESLPYFVGKRINDAGSPTEFRIPPSSQKGFSPSVNSVLSPDGLWLVFESWPDGVNHDLYLATINGANLTKLTDDASFEFGGVWRP